MAEPDVGEHTGEMLTHKVGPLPVWLWGVIAVGVYYWYTHYGPGASSSTTGSTTTTGIGSDLGSSGDTGSSQNSAFKTNAAWEAAALNYLVSVGDDPTEAGAALYAYLNSKQMTSKQEHMVDLAIEAVGPPPKVPAPGPHHKPPKHRHPHPRPRHKNGGGGSGPPVNGGEEGGESKHTQHHERHHHEIHHRHPHTGRKVA